jgi:hypothetical protein
MMLELSQREAVLVLAALRNWQDESKNVDMADQYEAYFEFDEPLSSEEIDAVCLRMAEAASKS